MRRATRNDRDTCKGQETAHHERDGGSHNGNLGSGYCQSVTTPLESQEAMTDGS